MAIVEFKALQRYRSKLDTDLTISYRMLQEDESQAYLESIAGLASKDEAGQLDAAKVAELKEAMRTLLAAKVVSMNYGGTVHADVADVVESLMACIPIRNEMCAAIGMNATVQSEEVPT
jgi:hypothetical protein